MTKPQLRPPLPEWEPPYLPWFSAPSLENNWPPGWMPADDWNSTAAVSAASTKSRMERVAQGDTGSIDGLSKASDQMVLRYRAKAAEDHANARGRS